MSTTSPTNSDNRSIRHFVRHYVEMVAAMVLGMVVLNVPADHLLHLFGTSASDRHLTTMIISMAVTMTLPMVAWMGYRGHSWRANAEMAAAMVIPAIFAVCVVRTGAETGTMILMTIEHAAMLVFMLLVMLFRYDEYATSGHVHRRARHAVVA